MATYLSFTHKTKRLYNITKIRIFYIFIIICKFINNFFFIHNLIIKLFNIKSTVFLVSAYSPSFRSIRLYTYFVAGTLRAGIPHGNAHPYSKYNVSDRRKYCKVCG